MAPPPMKAWRVISRKELTHDVFEIVFARPDGFDFRAGQYISIVVPGAGPGGRNLRRAYSIASAPQWTDVELCVKLVDHGPGTQYLNSLKVGSEIQAQGPFGDFCLEHDLSLPTLFIGTGTGLAPLRAMVLSNEWQTKAPVSFLLGVRNEQDIIYPEMFSSNRIAPFEEQRYIDIALSRPSESWQGYRGRVTQYIQSMQWDWKSSHYYLCGSGAMIQDVKQWLMAERQVTKEQIHTEKYF